MLTKESAENRFMTGMKLTQMTKLVVFALIIGVAASVSAQMSDKAALESAMQDRGLGIRPALNPASLLDFSRIRWSNSYSVSFFSGGNNSGSFGLLNSTMLYDLSSKLTIGFNLGIAHTGGAWTTDRNATFLPGFTLDYHPSEKFRLSFMVQRVSGAYNPFANRSGIWHNPVSP